MKKTYIAPDMEIVKIQSAGILAQSLGLNGGSVPGSAALAPDLDFETDATGF